MRLQRNMTFWRYFCRRRCLLKVGQVLVIVFIIRVVLISFDFDKYGDTPDAFVEEFEEAMEKKYNPNKSDVYVEEFEGAIEETFNPYKENAHLSHQNDANGVDMYTSDLLDITVYDFVTGKRFKEYAIPVKNESIAYGPKLDNLEVFVIPFSHVDPGYGATFEGYYKYKSQNTLTNMVKKLEEHTDLTFQWAETIFLERWWRDISDDVKDQVRALIQDGRLEILSGGWVMPDEAITHYSPVIDQLIEGHQWLWENLGVKPKNNWANDPFGYSSTFSYLWKKSGMENMVILRINQALKGTLMAKQALEFMWKPLWSSKSSNDILCHMMPYRGYWIGDTCGPYNQHICSEYAFMHAEKVKPVTDDNVEEKSRILYEQYRITAELYRRDTLNANQKPVPQNLYLPMFLGEDFSYVREQDFDLIYENYRKLFHYMNAKSEWKIKLKFGTVAEYFAKIKANQEQRTMSDGSRFPTIAGDFFPYTDYQSDFWTGYYTTRPFNKQLSRELQSILKMADIFHSYAHAHAKSNNISYKSNSEVMSLLCKSRRALGMFLHHDGITGTALLQVVRDFAINVFSALKKVKRAIKLIIFQLLRLEKIPKIITFGDTVERHAFMSLSLDKIVDIDSSSLKDYSYLTLINPTPRNRNDVFSFIGKTKENYLLISHGKKTFDFEAREISPNDGVYKIYFPVTLPPVSIMTFRIETFQTKDNIAVKELNKTSTTGSSSDKSVVLQNDYLYLELDRETGFPRKMKIKSDDNSEIDILTQVLAYKSLRSGPYIFSPDGNAKMYLDGTPTISINEGPLVSEVKSVYPKFTLLTRLYNVDGTKGMGIHLSAEFDMNLDDMDTELILRFQTSLNNGNIFYTDQNGFQLIGRKTRVHQSTEENYFPITTMMLIEDSKRRLTLHTAQPHGAACLDNGWMEVMLDRRVKHNDGKGIREPLNDNILTAANFVLQLESIDIDIRSKNFRYAFPSGTALVMNELLNEPTYGLFLDGDNRFKEYNLQEEQLGFSAIRHPFPCGLSLAVMRNLAKSDLSYNGTSLVLHHTSTLFSFEEDSSCMNRDGSVTLETLFPSLNVSSKRETSLTHLYELANIGLTDNLKPDDMELRSFKIEF